MKLQFVKSWAGRPEEMPRESKDCTVRATAHALGICYVKAHELLKKAGRQDNTGFEFGAQHEELGFEMRPDLGCMWLERLLPKIPRGRFVVTIRRHAFAIVHGTVYDHKMPRARASVFMVYEAVGVDENQALDSGFEEVSKREEK